MNNSASVSNFLSTSSSKAHSFSNQDFQIMRVSKITLKTADQWPSLRITVNPVYVRPLRARSGSSWPHSKKWRVSQGCWQDGQKWQGLTWKRNQFVLQKCLFLRPRLMYRGFLFHAVGAIQIRATRFLISELGFMESTYRKNGISTGRSKPSTQQFKLKSRVILYWDNVYLRPWLLYGFRPHVLWLSYLRQRFSDIRAGINGINLTCENRISV